jgi:hypothetical protein
VSDTIKGSERRAEKRLSLSLPIILLDQKIKSKNISPGGVYFEVITNDIKMYSPGKALKIEVLVNTSRPEIPNRRVRLTGVGKVVRADEMEIINDSKRLGIALKFGEILRIEL